MQDSIVSTGKNRAELFDLSDKSCFILLSYLLVMYIIYVTERIR